MQYNPELFGNLKFEEASSLWLESRKDKLKPRTHEMYESYVRQLGPFFRDTEVRRIDIGMIHAYQQYRKKSAGASAINHEIECIIGPLLKIAGIWEIVREHYERVPAPKWRPPKVLTEEQENHFFEIAARNPDYQVAYWVTSITNNASASGQEIRKLRLGDVSLKADPPTMRVPYDPEAELDATKNDYRDRVIPLNEVALKQLTRAILRANKLGANKPTHYIFPYRVKKNTYDISRPASPSFIRTSFRNLKLDAEMTWVTPHMFRHQIITKLLENGAAEETVRSIAGHVSRQMMEHYSHTRIQAKSAVLDKLARAVPKIKRGTGGSA